MASMTPAQLQCLDDLANEARIHLHLLSLARANTADLQRHHATELTVHVLVRSASQIVRMEACQKLSPSPFPRPKPLAWS